MNKPERITPTEMRVAVKEAKRAGAPRVIFDGGRIVIELERIEPPEDDTDDGGWGEVE